jgi:hypothetical protein
MDQSNELKERSDVVYLAIMFVVAAVGMTVLWVQQRRERSHLETVERFQSSMAKISPETGPRPAGTRKAVRRESPGEANRLDPARREAARRRLDARRRAALARASSGRQAG